MFLLLFFLSFFLFSPPKLWSTSQSLMQPHCWCLCFGAKWTISAVRWWVQLRIPLLLAAFCFCLCQQIHFEMKKQIYTLTSASSSTSMTSMTWDWTGAGVWECPGSPPWLLLGSWSSRLRQTEHRGCLQPVWAPLGKSPNVWFFGGTFEELLLFLISTQAKEEVLWFLTYSQNSQQSDIKAKYKIWFKEIV